MVDVFIHSLVTFFTTIDPIALVPLFISVTEGQDIDQRRRIAYTACLAATVVLVVFAVSGDFILRALGIGIPALRIAGGVLLFLLAIDMVFARSSGIRSTTPREAAEANARDDVAVFPLAVPLIAGPATITAVVLLTSEVRHSFVLQGVVSTALLLILVCTFFVLVLASRVMGFLGVTGVNVVGRVLGIILAALAVQFILDGLIGAGALPKAG